MIHSLSGGIIADYENLIYARVLAPLGRTSAKGRVTRVENVTKQTAPYPVNRAREIEGIL